MLIGPRGENIERSLRMTGPGFWEDALEDREEGGEEVSCSSMERVDEER